MENGFSHLKYVEYHKELAEKCKEIQHNAKHNIAFFSTDATEIKNKHGSSKSKIGDVILHLLDLRGRLKGKGDRITDEISGGFVIFVKHDYNKNDWYKMDVHLDRAKEIGMQVIAKIKHDSQQGCSPLDHFDMDRVSYRQTEIMFTNYVGYQFTFPVHSKQPVQYKPDQWL
jgi:hypothetical protein